MQQEIDIKQINKKQRKWRGLYWVSVVPILAFGVTYISAYTYAIQKKEDFSALNYYSNNFNSRELLYFDGSKSLQINKNVDDFYKKVTTDWGKDSSYFDDIEIAVSVLENFGVDPDANEETASETTEALEWRDLRKQISHAVLTFDQLIENSNSLDDINYWIELAKDLQKNMKFITYSMPATSITFNGKAFLSPTISNWTVGRWLNELNYHWERTNWTKFEKMPEILDAFKNVETLNLTENNEASDLVLAYMFYLMSITSPSIKKPVFSANINDDEYAFEAFASNSTLSFTKPLPRMFNELSSINKSMTDYQLEIKSILDFEKDPVGQFHSLSKTDIFIANDTSKNDFSDYFVKLSDLTIEIHKKIKDWKTQNPAGKLERISFNGEMIIDNYDTRVATGAADWNAAVNYYNSPVGTPRYKFTQLENDGYTFYKQLFPSANNVNKDYEHYLIFSSLIEVFAFDIKNSEKTYIDSHASNSDIYYGGDPKISNSVFNENFAPGVTRAFPIDITNTSYGGELIYTREYFTARSADEMEQKLKRFKGNLRKYKTAANNVSDYYLVDPEMPNKIIEFNKMTQATDIDTIVRSLQGSSFDMQDPMAGSFIRSDISYLINSAPIDMKKEIFITGPTSTSRYEWYQTKPDNCSDVQWENSNYYTYNGGSYTKLNLSSTLLGDDASAFKNSAGDLFIFGSPLYFNKWIEHTYEPNLFNTNSTTYSVYKSDATSSEPAIIAKAYDKVPVSYIPLASQYLSDVTSTTHLIMDNDRIVIDSKPYELRYSFRNNKYIPSLPL